MNINTWLPILTSIIDSDRRAGDSEVQNDRHWELAVNINGGIMAFVIRLNVW